MINDRTETIVVSSVQPTFQIYFPNNILTMYLHYTESIKILNLICPLSSEDNYVVRDRMSVGLTLLDTKAIC